MGFFFIKKKGIKQFFNTITIEMRNQKNYTLVLSNASRRYFRTHMCGELSSKIVGQKVQVSGWIQNIRMDKFIILRDRTGLCQVLS